MTRVTELMAKRKNVYDQAQALRTLRDSRPEGERRFSAEEQQNWDRMVAEIQELTRDIQTEQEQEALERSVVTEVASGDQSGAGGGGGGEQRGAGTTPEDEGEDTYARAFAQYVRRGHENLQEEVRNRLTGFDPETGEELRAQGIATGAAGGFLVPGGFRNKLQEAEKDFSGVRQVAEIINTDIGNDLPWPTNDDTANEGAILSENTQDTEQDLVIGQKTLKAYMFTSKIIRVSLQLMQDAAFDLDNFVPRKGGQRIGRIQNRLFTIGTGTNQPEGIVTAAVVGQTGAAGQVTSFTYTDLVKLQFSVDSAYRSRRPRWMMHDTTIAATMLLVDTTNRPLWVPSLVEGQPDTILGFGIVANNHMPVMAASAKSILFGDFEAGYVIRDVTGVGLLRFVERYGDFLQVGFLAYQRSDGKAQDTSAYKAYAHPAA